MNRKEEYYFGLVAKMLEDLIKSRTEFIAADVLRRFSETKGDAISQRQAEKEFGRKWLHDHIKVYGEEIYTVGMNNPNSEAVNQKRTFSRSQLAKIRMEEITPEGLSAFTVRFYQLFEAEQAEAVKNLPAGMKEKYFDDLKQKYS